ncbi:MAG TPA: hypothetical protein VNN20_13560 [Thermodesulfobacteriota bacterium]|nr:hypothetical protein [Thermodesulfobacteriota bacterium]
MFGERRKEINPFALSPVEGRSWFGGVYLEFIEGLTMKEQRL